MKTVVLISCSKKKRKESCEAQFLYDKSSFFRGYLKLARAISNDVFVISAKLGLVSLDTVIDWYDYTLKGKSKHEKNTWGERIAKQIADTFDVHNTKFVILAGKDYYAPLQAYLPHIKLPLLGVDMYHIHSKIKELYNDVKSEQGSLCHRLHKLFNTIPRFSWDMISKIDFNSGIYIIFEKGETYHGMDRIVRVGTHKSDGRLRRRLRDHYQNKNKDGSIFRKNVGKAILNKIKHPYLDIWKEDTSKKETVIRLGDRYDRAFQQRVEKIVSKYMREYFTFICFPVVSEEERLRLEKRIIAALNGTFDFVASSEWRGKHSTEREIIQSGMWLKQGLGGTPLSNKEYTTLENYCLTAFPNMDQSINEANEVKSAVVTSPTVTAIAIGKGTKTGDMVRYIENKLSKAKAAGAISVTIKSGEIHKELGLVSSMPIVCNAMRKLKKDGDIYRRKTPSGYSSTLEIEYFCNEKTKESIH